MPDPNSYIDGLYNTIKLNVPDFKKSPQEFSDALNNDAAYRQGIYTMLKDNIPTFTKTTSEFNDSVIKKISAKDAMAKYGITNQMPAKESTIVVNPQETLKGTVAKETGISTEKKRVKETPVALENSADLYFKNNGIAPTKIQRQQKINDLKKGLESDELVLGYSPVTGQPRMERKLGGFNGFIEGTKQGFKQEGEARAFIGMNPDEQIKAMNKELQSDNEYLPANPSYTMLGGLGHSIGEGAPMMGKAITGAVVGSALAAAAPETGGYSLAGVAPTMAFLFSAPGAANVAYMDELKRRYAEGKKNGLSDYDAYHKASNQALVSEGVSLATNAFLSRIPATKASGEGLNNALKEYVKSGAKTSGEFAASTAAGTATNELTAKAQGFNKDKDVVDILGEAAKSGTEAGLMGMALHVVSHPEILVTLPKYLQAQVKGYINKADVGEVHAALDEMADKGIATPQGVDAAKEKLASYDQAAKKVPSGLDEETSGVITGLVEKKNNLEKQKSQLDPSFHEDINNEIEAINKKIEIAKKSDNPIHAEIDANGETLFTPKSFEDLTKAEKQGVVVPKDYGEAEVIEKGEGENKTFVPKASYIEKNGALEINKPIKIEEEKTYTDKSKAQEAADNALRKHYYENGLQDNLKPESKNAKEKIETKVIQQPQDEGTASSNEPVSTETGIPATTEPDKVEQFAERIASGEKMTSPEDLQFYDNNKKEVEDILAKKAQVDTPSSIVGSSVNKADWMKTPIEAASDMVGDEGDGMKVGLMGSKVNTLLADSKFKENHQKIISDAIKDGKYQQAISNGEMTAIEAKNIIEKSETEVPKDIAELAKKEQNQSKETKGNVVSSEDVSGTQSENPSQKTEPIVKDTTPPTPPVSDIQDSGTGSVGNEKGILNRLFTSEKISKKVKDIFETKGLKYAPKSQEEARVVAKDIIGEFGYDQSIGMAESGRFDGDVNSMIFAESIDQLSALEGKATTPEEATQHAAQWADYSIRYDELARDKGRFISAIYDFYKKSPLGTVIKENRNREGIFNDWFKGKEVNYKELFDEIKKTVEGKNALKEEFENLRKEERATERATKRKNIENFFDKAKFKGDALYSTVIPPQLINGAIELMKKAFLAGESVSNAIKVAIDHISKEIKDWDAEKFRSEWESKLSIFEKKSKETIDKTSPEYLLQKQKEYLEKFSKKLSGLNDQQKEQVIQKSIKKLIENGALEFDEFKKIIAQVLGVSELTPEQAVRMKELSKKINQVQDAAELARKERTPEGIKKFNKALLEAEEAAHELDNMVYVKAAPLSRAMDVIKLNTLGLVSLVKNISYNVFYQPVLFSKSLFKTGMDYSIYGLSQLSNKAFGTKIITPESNVFLAQKDYFKQAGEGFKRSAYQVKSGLQDRDYFSKEVRISQIRPRHAWKDLWAWRKGEKFLTNAQVADKIIQGTGGVNAEVIARLLNVGDKWQKFGAEGGEAGQIAKLEFKLKEGIDKKLFLQFPKEESYRLYKERGLSDEEAMARAEEIEKRIIKAGEKAITQQDNWLSDKLKEFDKYLDKKSEDDAIYNVANGLTKILKGFSMPFVKIPLNVAWNVMNFVNPELAVLQSGFYGYIAVKNRLAGDMVKARENTRIAKDWMAHAATGTAMLAATGYLANIGAIRARNDFEEDKARESRGESNYGRQYTLNVSLMNRLATGGSTEEQDGDVWVDLSWFGIAGNIMNIQAKRVEEKKQNKDAGQEDSYFDDLTSRLTSSAAEGLDNGVFSGTNNLLSAYKTGGGYVDSWMIGMSNLGMNFFEPATYAQFSKASMDEKSVYKAESLWAEIINNQKQRDILFRQFAGKAPSDVTIWGEPYKKAGGLEGVAFNMLGFEKTDASKFGMILYDDYKKSKNTGFFPPAVLDKIKVNGADVKLPVDEATDLKRMIGQKRKSMVEPFIMGKAYYAGKTYSQIESEADKVEALKIIYDQAREIAIADFRNKYPKYQETERTHQQKTQEEKERKNKEKLLKQVTQ